MRDSALQSLRELTEVVDRLRAPGGCPWDREQTHQTLRPYLLEEAYEALEAIESGSAPSLREELGDLLLQVLMHAAIAQEDGPDGFDIGDVADSVRRKMVGRHPHVFAGGQVSGAAEVVVNWERLKAEEKVERLSVLDGVPRSLPALAHALGVQKRPARVGFDLTAGWPEAAAAVRQKLDNVERAASATSQAADRGADWNVESGHTPSVPSPLEEAVGQLLFTVVALARRARVNPEDALRRESVRFGERFRAVEQAVRASGGDVHSTQAQEWARRWEDGLGT
ncbi:MAG: nucleoside triphosphate pyrophosphohydrolase [Candidatus Dormibacteria bacterium]